MRTHGKNGSKAIHFLKPIKIWIEDGKNLSNKMLVLGIIKKICMNKPRIGVILSTILFYFIIIKYVDSVILSYISNIYIYIYITF